jgi:phosphoglycolate phosphatase
MVLFDYDGTLADSFPWLLSMVDRVIDQYHLPRVEAKDYETLRSMSAQQIIRRMGGSIWKIPLIARDMRRLAGKDIDRITLFPGVDHLLRELSGQSIRLGVVSSNSTTNVRRLFGPELAALIQDYECNIRIFGKAARIRKIVKRSGISRFDTLYVGDEQRDLGAARKAEVAFGAVAWGYARIDALRERSPDEIFHSMEELISRFKS